MIEGASLPSGTADSLPPLPRPAWFQHDGEKSLVSEPGPTTDHHSFTSNRCLLLQFRHRAVQGARWPEIRRGERPAPVAGARRQSASTTGAMCSWCSRSSWSCRPRPGSAPRRRTRPHPGLCRLTMPW